MRLNNDGRSRQRPLTHSWQNSGGQDCQERRLNMMTLSQLDILLGSKVGSPKVVLEKSEHVSMCACFCCPVLHVETLEALSHGCVYLGQGS